MKIGENESLSIVDTLRLHNFTPEQGQHVASHEQDHVGIIGHNGYNLIGYQKRGAGLQEIMTQPWQDITLTHHVGSAPHCETRYTVTRSRAIVRLV